MISKILGTKWMKGKFIDIMKHWLEDRFYMADVPLTNLDREGIATAFTATHPEKLYSWNPNSISWEGTKR